QRNAALALKECLPLPPNGPVSRLGPADPSRCGKSVYKQTSAQISGSSTRVEATRAGEGGGAALHCRPHCEVARRLFGWGGGKGGKSGSGGKAGMTRVTWPCSSPTTIRAEPCVWKARSSWLPADAQGPPRPVGLIRALPLSYEFPLGPW